MCIVDNTQLPETVGSFDDDDHDHEEVHHEPPSTSGVVTVRQKLSCDIFLVCTTMNIIYIRNGSIISDEPLFKEINWLFVSHFLQTTSYTIIYLYSSNSFLADFVI